MTNLLERILVDVPLPQGGSRVVAYVREQESRHNGALQFPLCLSLPIPGLAKPLTIQKDVLVTFYAAPDLNDMKPHYRVAWEPRDGGPFPNFEGTFTIEGAEDYDRFWLVLSGSYEPPIGLVGGAFDALAGRFIARATARDLLGRIRDSVETAYELDEAAKVSRREASTSL